MNQNPKFELNKETLMDLSDSELNQVNGAWDGGFTSVAGALCDGGGSQSIACVRW